MDTRTDAISENVQTDLMRAAMDGSVTRRQLIASGWKRGMGIAGIAGLLALAGSRQTDARGTTATSIPPNCIYVCCDGTCDSWKMCMKCVTWPKATVASSATLSADRAS